MVQVFLVLTFPIEFDMKIRNLSNIPFEKLSEAFARAFADYEIQINDKQLRTMLQRRGFDPELSFAAFDNDNIVSFTFNGTGKFNGIPTAYDTGTGTIGEYRGQNLASEVFSYSVPFLKENGIKQYLLEVLQHNLTAVKIYRKNGFEVSREFNYFVQDNHKINIKEKVIHNNFSVQQVSLEECKANRHFMDFNPSWQNSFESIERMKEDFIATGAFINSSLAGYCIFEPDSGDITQLAVDKKHRGNGIGSILLKEALKSNHGDSVKAINTESSCDSIKGFLESCNINLKGKQFEMIKKL